METEIEARTFGANIGLCKCGHVEEAHGAGWRAYGGGTEDANLEALEHVGADECVLITPGSPTGWLCGCEGYQEIAKVSSVFPFRRGQYGDGRKHTLVTGLMQLARSGGVFVWTLDGGPMCDMGVAPVEVEVFAVEENGTEIPATLEESGSLGEHVALPPFPVRGDGKWGAGVGPTTILCKECFDARISS